MRLFLQVGKNNRDESLLNELHSRGHVGTADFGYYELQSAFHVVFLPQQLHQILTGAGPTQLADVLEALLHEKSLAFWISTSVPLFLI